MQFYLSLDFAIEQYLLLNGYNLVITIVKHNNLHALQRNFIRNNSQTCLTCLHNLTLVYSRLIINPKLFFNLYRPQHMLLHLFNKLYHSVQEKNRTVHKQKCTVHKANCTIYKVNHTVKKAYQAVQLDQV